MRRRPPGSPIESAAHDAAFPALVRTPRRERIRLRRHLSPRAAGASSRRCRVGAIPAFPRQPQGRAPRALAAVARLRPWFNVLRDTVTHGIVRRCTACGPGSPPMSGFPAAGPRRASTARSIGFLFNGRLSPASRATPGVGAARERRATGRAQLQAAPSARHLLLRHGGTQRAGRRRARGAAHAERFARRWSRCTTGLGREQRQLLARRCASISGRSTNGFAALLPAGFYYKTFKWPDWQWFEPSDPAHGRARPAGHRADATRPLRGSRRRRGRRWWSAAASPA